jgi:tetratricopeptide (TPR) repeat protein
MIRIIAVLTLLISLVTTGSLAATEKTIATTSKTYQDCTAMARTDPERARQFAASWVQRENSASAQHCHAIALFALKRYKDAALALERLSIMVTEKNPALWLNILRQSSRAWSLSQDNTRAITVLGKAIGKTAYPALSDPPLARMVSDLLGDRSRIYIETGQDLLALQDLDQALSLTPGHESVLLMRSAIFINRNEHDMAMRDLNIILSSRPGQPEALAMMKRISGGTALSVIPPDQENQ